MDKNLETLICDTLTATGRPGIGKLIAYLKRNHYFTIASHSHNSWEGGAAEHMWATYIMARGWRDQLLIKVPRRGDLSHDDIKKYALDDKLAIVCMLHDMCDMNVTVFGIDSKTNKKKDYSHDHGLKSYWIMRNHDIGTPAEQNAVKYHMHSDARCSLNDSDALAEYNVLHTLVCKADHIASGGAWNYELFMRGLSQAHHKLSEPGSLRSVAMDRTCQCLDKHMYMDCNYGFHFFKGFARQKIQWNYDIDVKDLAEKIVTCDEQTDVITMSARMTDRRGLCLVVGIDPECAERDKYLGRQYHGERDLLICSNLLLSLFKADKADSVRKFRFAFTLRDEVKPYYTSLGKMGCAMLKKVLFFREGASNGYRMVDPWEMDVLLVSGMKGKPFIAKM